MAPRRQTHNVDSLIDQIDRSLATFGRERSQLTLRQKVLQLVDIFSGVKDLSVSTLVEHGWDVSAGRERIRLYLVEYVGQIIDGAEIEVVGAISDYPRRIRELRVEHGYAIASGASPDPESGIDLQPAQYLLLRADPDADAARRWHVANRIRRGAGGSQKRILQFLCENVGQPVTTEELAYVARDAREFGRRTRELRTEHGYSVATHFTGRPDLGQGQYVLESLERRSEAHDRHVPESVQRIVYARDNNSCRICGWDRNRWSRDNPRFLELHHLEHHQHGGPNEEANLAVLCSKCHDEVHAGEHEESIELIRQSL